MHGERQEYHENLNKTGKLDPPRMLDSECVKHLWFENNVLGHL
jgi:hypothetical protein